MLNEFNAGLSSQLKEIRDLSDKAGAHISHAKGATGPEAAAELDEAAAKKRRIGEILRNFKLKNDE